MKKILFIILFAAVLIGGSFFVQQTVFAQAIGGKIVSYLVPPAVDVPRHMIVGFRPSMPPGVICAICLGPAGIGRWFLGFSAGGIITIGGLGGF